MQLSIKFDGEYRDSAARHLWGSEMLYAQEEPGQNHRAISPIPSRAVSSNFRASASELRGFRMGVVALLIEIGGLQHVATLKIAKGQAGMQKRGLVWHIVVSCADIQLLENRSVGGSIAPLAPFPKTQH